MSTKSFKEALAFIDSYVDKETALHAELRILLVQNGWEQFIANDAADFFIRVRDHSPKEEWEK